jgi:hypothetical protein
MAGFVLHAGRRPTMVLPPGAEPGHPNVDTFYGAHQHLIRTPDVQQPPGELCHLLDSSLNDYINKFYQRRTRCDELSEPQQIAIFSAGLSEPLKTDVELDAPATLEDVASHARAYIRRSTVAVMPTGPSSHRSSARSVATTAVTSPPAASGAPPPLRSKTAPGLIKLSPEEMARCREIAQCFKCPEQWSRAHQKTCRRRTTW